MKGMEKERANHENGNEKGRIIMMKGNDGGMTE